MKNRKILFFDIDGTLLSEETGTVPHSATIALKNARKNGHLIFINTGRPFSTINQCIKDLHPDGYVCGCGTYIRYQDNILLSNTLTKKRCQEIRQLTKDTNIEAILEGKNCVYFTTQPRLPSPAKIKQNYLELGFPVKDLDDPDLSFDKFAIWFDEQSDLTKFKEGITDFDYIVRGSDFGEIVPLGFSKATGIQFLLDYFMIDSNDCYVFGDSANDEPMLRYVKHAIVMGNGEPYLFEHAYYVTKDIEEDGIYHALEHLQLIK